MNEIRVRIKDLIKELQMLERDGYECADLTIEEAKKAFRLALCSATTAVYLNAKGENDYANN